MILEEQKALNKEDYHKILVKMEVEKLILIKLILIKYLKEEKILIKN